MDPPPIKDILYYFTTLGKQMKWEPDLLLQVGMDGPNVNLKFNKKKKQPKCLIAMECHSYVWSYIKVISFKISPAQKEDYRIMEVITEIEAKFV